jgi:tetratricopeptide (TPR) repeat protein
LSDETRVVDLASTSWPRLLFALLSQRFTGSIAIEQAGPKAGTRTLIFWGGFPLWTDWVRTGSRLGELLVKAEAIDPASLEQAIAERGDDDGRIGEYACEHGLADVEQVTHALREQCEMRVESIIGVSAGKVTISSDPLITQEEAETYAPVDVLRVIQRGVRQHYDPQRIDVEMASLAGEALRITSTFGKYQDRFGFSSVELRQLVRLAQLPHIEVGTLASTTDVDWIRTLQLLYTLWACQMLVAADQQTQPLEVGAPMLEALVAALAERIGSGAGAHEVLGIDKDADLATIDAAWQRIAQQLDPDKLPDGVSSALAGRVVEVRTAIDEVRVASRARREALAEMSAQRLLREGKFVKALVLLEDLVQLRPHDLRAQAGMAWCRYQTSTRGPRDGEKALAALDAVIAEDGSFGSAHYYRGHVLRELGRPSEALLAFEQALALDPSNVDAERHARAIRSGNRQEDRGRDSVPQFQPPAPRKPRHPLWSGAWPAIWIFSGLLLLAMAAAQIILRMDF